MIIFAHRGASGYAPENTIAALNKAVELGCNAVEIDVQLTKDRVPVVIHDVYLNRLTDSEGYVEKSTSHEILKLKIKNRFNNLNFSETIPTLEEYLKLLPKNFFLNVEIKTVSLFENSTEDEIINVIKRNFPLENILISSFDHTILKRISDKYPSIKLGMLLGNRLACIDRYIEQSGIKLFSVNYGVEIVSREDISLLHDLGYKVFVYTVNSLDIYGELKNIGVDGIFSDYPDKFQL